MWEKVISRISLCWTPSDRDCRLHALIPCQRLPSWDKLYRPLIPRGNRRQGVTGPSETFICSSRVHRPIPSRVFVPPRLSSGLGRPQQTSRSYAVCIYIASSHVCHARNRSRRNRRRNNSNRNAQSSVEMSTLHLLLPTQIVKAKVAHLRGPSTSL